jgi:Glyoxalase/Bleomycin resistance protein/Dioxygenase superfamily
MSPTMRFRRAGSEGDRNGPGERHRQRPDFVKRHTLLGAAAVIAISISANANAQATASNKAKGLTLLAAGIPCSDLDRSIAFYTKGLGFSLGTRLDADGVVEAPLTQGCSTLLM